MGKIGYTRDSISEIKFIGKKREIEPNDWIVIVWSKVGEVYCATRLYSPSTGKVKVWDGYAARYKDGKL